ncbi:hypothetical protein [uncultured Gammaproteobacteria bacterium]|nr:hypothetical protein [uncultured Gammaproteobacteria bacterium]
MITNKRYASSLTNKNIKKNPVYLNSYTGFFFDEFLKEKPPV